MNNYKEFFYIFCWMIYIENCYINDRNLIDTFHDNILLNSKIFMQLIFILIFI